MSKRKVHRGRRDKKKKRRVTQFKEMTDNLGIENELTIDGDCLIKLCTHNMIGNRECKCKIIHLGLLRDLSSSI